MADNIDDVDDIVVKGAIDKNTPETSNVITYTEKPTDRRCLDVVVRNPEDLPGGDQNKGVVPCYSSSLDHDYSDSSTPLTGSFDDIYSYTGSGRLAAFSLTFTLKNFELKLLADSEEVLLLSPAMLENLYLPPTDNTIGVMYEANKKTMTFYPRFPVCFDTDLKIQARQTSGTVSNTYQLVVIEKVT